MSKNKNTSKQAPPEEEGTTVFLGYIENGDKIENELPDASKQTTNLAEPSSSRQDGDKVDSIAPWLVNKIGGHPIFPLNGLDISSLKEILESIKCRHCKSICVLAFQMNSPIDESPLDRVMQVYTCVKSDCIKHSWITLRCMFKPDIIKEPPTQENEIGDNFKLISDATFGHMIAILDRAFFEPYYVSVLEEPTGKENFAKNNLEALKLAASFKDLDLKPAPIEEKYKNLKNYKAPQPPAHLNDLEDFEKFQLEKLYSNDKDMYRFYKRLARYQAQVVRYDWEGKPMLNSNKIKLNIQTCPTCNSKRMFEFQIMSALINYLRSEKEFDRESMDFSSIIVHSCHKNCSTRTFNIEDTYFMPDPDSRIFNKVKQKMLSAKLKNAPAPEDEQDQNNDNS